jgi:MULE transposase domain
MEVLVMDSTDNKTNRFHLPLFNICGSTFSNASLSVASAFLSSEDKESFKWVLARFFVPKY